MDIGILLILITTAIATSVLGVFLVLRKMSMIVDSISHTVLLGIVIAFLFIQDLASPLLIIGAALMGIITVFLTELLVKSKKASEESATGLVFPLLFSIAIILISSKFKNVHLDLDVVLLGKIELAPFDKIFIGGISIGPKLFYIMLVVMIINLLFTKLFFKELKIISFDVALAATLGFIPFIIHYLLMTLVSLTAVSAFSAVGSILVIALMIGPPATALLFSKDLKKMLLFSIIIGVINSILGYILAIFIDVNISGMIATVTLLMFLIVLAFEPKKGIISTIIKRYKLKDEFTFLILVFHVHNHAGIESEIKCENIQKELKWSKNICKKQIDRGLKSGIFIIENNLVHLTSIGNDFYNLKANELRV